MKSGESGMCDGSWGIEKAVRGVSGLHKTFTREKSQTRELSPEVLCEGTRVNLEEAKEKSADKVTSWVPLFRPDLNEKPKSHERERGSFWKATNTPYLPEHAHATQLTTPALVRGHECEPTRALDFLAHVSTLSPHLLRPRLRSRPETMLFQIVLYLLRVGWRSFEEKVVYPAETLMRRLGIRVEIELHAQVVISHRGRQLSDNRLGPWRLVFPRDELAPVLGREVE
ncbi:hypothetical protein EDB87DRAFT_1581709 [Lactarius vividus]|nr:hypothetical protein EDB87DRAFT_1581709 [Lactarius vividus]